MLSDCVINNLAIYYCTSVVATTNYYENYEFDIAHQSIVQLIAKQLHKKHNNGRVYLNNAIAPRIEALYMLC